MRIQLGRYASTPDTGHSDNRVPMARPTWEEKLTLFIRDDEIIKNASEMFAKRTKQAEDSPDCTGGVY